MRRYRLQAEIKRKEKVAFKRYSTENRERLNATNYRWRLANPVKWRQIKRRADRRRHQREKSGYEGVALVNLAIECIYDFRDVCIDATKLEHHVDHVLPLAAGGLHVPWNLQVLTAKANLTKGRS
jgi:hypothetical protein